jgi:HAD superfamily hydrolase (TIGR01459 family)
MNFNDLSPLFEHFLLDAYGVFWGSKEIGFLPGTKETMAKLISEGKKVGILSNATALAKQEEEKFAKYGVYKGSHYHFILTSGEFTSQLLKLEKLPFATPNKKYWLLGSDHPHFSPHCLLFKESKYTQTEDIDDADFIYIGIPHIGGVDQEKPDGFIALLEKIKSKKTPILCSNPDSYVYEGKPARPVVRQGMIAKLLQEMGSTVYFIGKPYPMIYKEAISLLNTSPSETLMVGDTPETDIRGAKKLGIKAALVMQTGMMQSRSKSSISQEDLPDYFIERL